MAKNAWELFQNWKKTGNYPGSSGYYADEDVLTSSPYGQSYDGYGYAGDRAKNSAAIALGLSPQDIGTSPDSWGTSGGTANDFATLGQDGRWYSSKTGKIFSGTDSKTGKTYNNGYEQIAVNDRYKAVNVVKDQGVADETSKLLDTLKTDAAGALKGFDEHLADFNTDLGNARTKANTALDTTGFENQLNARQGKYDASLDAAGKGYTDLNAQNDAAERAIVQQAYDTLPEYDAAAQAIGDRQLGALNQNLSKYKLGTDTPRSLSSADMGVLARNVADVQLPLEQQRIARKFDLLQNLSLPVQRELYGNERARITQFNPKIAQQEFASGQATAQTIQGVRQQVATMAPQLAIQFMQSLGVPAQLQQQILSGQLGQLGQIAQLDSASNYQGLMDQQGAYPTQAQYYGLSIPGYPSASSPRTGNTLTGPGGGNAPITVSPGYNPTSMIDTTTGGYGYNPIPSGTGPALAGYRTRQPGNVSTGAGGGYYNFDNTPQAGYRYNPQTGQLEDATGNQWNPEYNPITGPDQG